MRIATTLPDNLVLLGSLALVVLLALQAILVHAQTQVQVELLSLDFSDPIEAMKHIDNSTENYDAGGDNSAHSYVDTVNQWYVFIGNNTDTSQGFDEPIAVLKGYDEPNGFQSYAILPYNYTVRAEFMVPSSPGYGNFYIFPRYTDVNNKYEVVVDTRYNNLVFNYVVDGSWANIKTSPLPFTIQRDTWYVLEVTVTWLYDPNAGSYVNKITATVYEKSNPSNTFTDSIEDSHLPPDQYNSLAFLGFDAYSEFKVYMDNLYIGFQVEDLGEEPAESLTPGDLDAVNMSATSDANNLFIRITLSSPITPGAETKWWGIQLDTDKDSRNTETGFDYEYLLLIGIDSNGNAGASVFDEQGNYLGQAQVIGGGIGYQYLVARIPLSLIGSPFSLYLYGYTEEGTTPVDGIPYDNTNSGYTGDYYTYYLEKPVPQEPYTTTDDPVGDATPDYLDIVSLGGSYDTSTLFFQLQVNGPVPWNGGSSKAIYRVYIDYDNNSSTGYQVGGIGADYMLEHVIGYTPKLWKYNGSGTDWAWVFVKREEYLYNPGAETTIVYRVVKADFTTDPANITILGQTGTSTSVADETGSLVAPVPEPGLLVAASAAVIVLVAAVTVRKKH